MKNLVDLIKTPKIKKEKYEISALDEFKLAYEQHFLNTMDRSRFVEADGFHPSILGTYYGKCARYHVYMLRGTQKENTFDPRGLRILRTGTNVHEVIQKDLADMGVLLSAEIPIDYEDPPVKGHCDGAIKWRDKVILIEIKSIGQDGYENRIKYNAPKPEHYDQANIYAYILGMDTIWIIYYNKNKDEIAIFERPASKEAAEKQLNKWRKIYQQFEDKELPKRPYKSPDSSACMSCPLKTMCWSDNTPS